MLFNSFEFLIFLPIIFCLYWFVFNKSLRGQNILILTASYFFYGWWSFQFLGLLVLSTVLDYAYGFWVASPNKRKARIFLWLSILNNLGILGVFKYYNFFALQFERGFESLGLHTNPVLLDVVLPVGISFYTFHGMSYVFDIYRGKQKPVSNAVDYAVFVSFFPLLVAGPIERANHLLPQVTLIRRFSYYQAVEGCRLILWGMFKKVVIADSLAFTVDKIFENYAGENGFTLIIGAIAFSFQIYADFSGYSDIAIGTAKLFGFELFSNFRFPYFSRDIAEFWRRWHISLSSWFRDYIYIPIGGSKGRKIKTVRNVFVIFLISALWHGAGWNFVAWGFIHACAFLPLLLIDRNRVHVTEIVASGRKLPNAKELRQMLVTFTVVCIAWIFFRADGIGMAAGYLKHALSDIIQNPGQFLHLPPGSSAFFYIVPFVLADWRLRRDERILAAPKSRLFLSFIIILTFLYLFDSIVKNENLSFIYFQF